MKYRSFAAGSLLAIAVVSCAPLQRGQTEELRVMVYNIHAGRDAGGVDNLERVARLVSDTRADVVLLQEVDIHTRRSGNVDQVARLRKLTGFHAAFGRTLDFQGGEYGIALLSRWPIDSAWVTPLPIDPPQLRSGVSYEPRGALRAFISAPFGTLVVLNTHLDASRADNYRRQEARTIVAIADSLREAGFLLVGGDFNSEPASAVQNAIAATPLRDAWAQCGSGNPFTYPAGSGVKRIDYLYLEPGVQCSSAAVLDSRASDHRPLFVVIRR